MGIKGDGLYPHPKINTPFLICLYGTLRDTGTYPTYTSPLCHLELLFPPDKCLTWPALCWVFKDNYKARSNTSPPNIYGRNKYERMGGGMINREVHMQ